VSFGALFEGSATAAETADNSGAAVAAAVAACMAAVAEYAAAAVLPTFRGSAGSRDSRQCGSAPAAAAAVARPQPQHRDSSRTGTCPPWTQWRLPAGHANWQRTGLARKASPVGEIEGIPRAGLSGHLPPMCQSGVQAAHAGIARQLAPGSRHACPPREEESR
jgi:hypothetical protein